MRVDKNSWHYKAITEETLGVEGVNSNFVSSSLCIYFWQVVASIVFKGFLLLVLLPVLLHLFVVLPLSSVVGAVVTSNFIPEDVGFIILFVEVAFSLVVLLICGGSALIDKYKDYRYEKFMEEPIDKEPSLVGQYIKAKKEKICPMIEFVEEE